jgi:hypothetical protein
MNSLLKSAQIPANKSFGQTLISMCFEGYCHLSIFSHHVSGVDLVMFRPSFWWLGLLSSVGKAKAINHSWLWLDFGLSHGLWQ